MRQLKQTLFRYLRGKVDIPGKESYIQTVRGMGYVIREK